MADVLEAATQPQPSGRLFTVGIPVFNGKSLLRDCLQSVINSTLPRRCFEIVVADDGSSEPETLAILEEFRQRLAADQGFFRVISMGANSGGAARPRNRIIEEATGEYIFFIDSDDRIGDQALKRIAEALATTPADWVAVHQVPVNGRAAVASVREARVEVPRTKALTTLTVHKVFRRAEIERQQLRFDEGLPSGQDVSFAFSYLLNAQRFLMLGGYDYYYLTRHIDNPDEPAHLSRRAKTPQAVIEKNERILRSMLSALRDSTLPEAEKRTIAGQIALPRVLLRQDYLKAIVRAGPVAGPKALRRLSKMLADPLVAGLDPAQLKDLTQEHLARIAKSDWAGLAYLLGMTAEQPPPRFRLAVAWLKRGHRFVDHVSGRARHRHVVGELERLHRFVEDIREAQDRLAVNLQAELALRDMLAATEWSQSDAAVPPLGSNWQLSAQAMLEVVGHILVNRPRTIVECGSGASTVWIGRALRRVGEGRLISLESSADSVAIVTRMVQGEGLGRVDVRHAPLEPVKVAEHEQPWYSVTALADVDQIDLLLIDGPPGRTSRLARYPAMPVLRDKLRSGATVMLDDCHRKDEQETLRRWLNEVTGLSLLRQVDRLAVLKVNPTAGWPGA